MKRVPIPYILYSLSFLKNDQFWGLMEKRGRGLKGAELQEMRESERMREGEKK